MNECLKIMLKLVAVWMGAMALFISTAFAIWALASATGAGDDPLGDEVRFCLEEGVPIFTSHETDFHCYIPEEQP
jgi:hypothetical protein